MTLYPPPSDPAAAEQLRLALRSTWFYARRAITLGAEEDDVYDQVVQAIGQVKAELGVTPDAAAG